MWITITIVAVALVALTIYDLVQRKHAILRNFPIVGHFRYWLEAVGPELRQYIVTDNDEERPFSRDQRRWVYASAKKENSYFGFGSDNEVELSPNYLIIRHTTFPAREPIPGEADYDPDHAIPVAKVLGAHRGRTRAFRPASAVNIGAMSFGALSGAAVEAINLGCKTAGCIQNTGEGGVAPHHQRGGDLVWQIGSGYFGCRDPRGAFDLSRFLDVVAANPIRAIEIKLSQGAKPGVGGILPAVKLTRELAEIRGVPHGQDCVSPNRHGAFEDADSMLDFVEMLADRTGLPIGIKSAVGQPDFWELLARLMDETDRGVDYIAIDGGEGGTGSAPLVFSDHVALPFKVGYARVFGTFAQRGLQDQVVFIGSGKLGLPETAIFAFALGCDMINVSREAMLAIGCIQAQRCHTNRCPTGVATQSKWLMRGLDPTTKSARLANYVVSLRKEILRICCACGVAHPALLSSDHVEILDGRFGSTTIDELFGYASGWTRPTDERRASIAAMMERPTAQSR